MSDARTDRAHYRFTVKEYVSGAPWIMFELLREPELPILAGGRGFLGFDLPSGTSYEGAKKIADFLNENIECVAATTFVRSANA